MDESSTTRSERIRGIAILAGLGLAILAGGTVSFILSVLPPYHYAEVIPGVLYRSGQLGWRDFARIRDRAGIRTIVDLCGEKRDTTEALEERAFAGASGVRHVHLPVPSGMIKAGPYIQTFLEIVDDPANRPVLVHCWKGVKRTGVMVAIARMEYLGADKEAALQGLNCWGRVIANFDETERACVEEYVPRTQRAEATGGSAPTPK
jgi:tyrosine-protein phosphatase SIW14